MVKSILLVDRKGRYVMACVMGETRLDPKAVRAHLGEGWRRLHFASPEEIETVTGCVMGAVAPIGLPHDVPEVFDEGLLRWDLVSISSGDPMAGLELRQDDLQSVVGAAIASIAKERDDGN
jgi:prolyl-tRNA editing enzyme YbaK/EbsC (Cys-tRNA(Pro) deacylase)